MPPSPPHDRRGFEIAIICALPLEADAVFAVFDRFYKDENRNYGQAPGDHNCYTTGVIGDHNVVLAHVPGMGTTNSAGVAAGILASFTCIKLALVVGICGGVPFRPDGGDEIFLGDVIFSTGVVQYDFGRQYPKELRRKDTVEDSLGRPPWRIRGLIAQLKTKTYRKALQTRAMTYLGRLQCDSSEAKYPGLDMDLLFESSYLHKHHGLSTELCRDCSIGPENICKNALETTCRNLKCDVAKLVKRGRDRNDRVSPTDCNPSVHFGMIGSGNAVMKCGEHRDRIAEEAKVIAFEMEGAGVWDFFPSVIIKGVCDYADTHKNKLWQDYAAATAASGMKAFLHWWAVNEKDKVPISEVRWQIPLNSRHEFVGRKKEMIVLESKLFQTEGRSRVAMFGLGGVGKSRIALELAHRTKKHHPTCSVFWVHAMDSSSFHKHILEIGRGLNIPGIDDDKADVRNLVKQRLSQEDVGNWLMILDGADDEDLWGPKLMGESNDNHLMEFLPENGRMLVTTRNRQVAAYIAGRDCVKLSEMSPEEATDTLKSILIDHTLLNGADTVSQLLEKLTYLPLALVQAASYINMNDATIKDYLELLEDTEENVIDLLSDDFGDYEQYSGGQNPVASTWLISFTRMRNRCPRAADYLAFISCLSEKNIPLSLLPDPASRKEMIELVGILTGYSFLRKQNEELANEVLFQMHRLVRLATRNWLRRQSHLIDSVKTTLATVEKRFPICTYENRNECALYLPHARILCDSEGISELKERYSLMEKMGICLVGEGRYSDALKLHHATVVWREQHYGSAHLETLTAFNSYGEALLAAGDFTEAGMYFERAFNGRESTLSLNNKLTLKSMSGLAMSYVELQQWEKAKCLSLVTIKASEKCLGPEDPDTLEYKSRLVWILYNQGDLEDAERLALQVREAKSKVLSKDDPHTLLMSSYLGAIYQSLGRFTKAIELKTSVLQNRTRILGKEHRQTLTSMVNLALTYRHVGRLDEAEALEIEALRIRERVLGADHPSTLTGMNNLAWTWNSQGRYDEAVVLMKRCISLSTQKLGPDHPTVVQRRYFWDSRINDN